MDNVAELHETRVLWSYLRVIGQRDLPPRTLKDLLRARDHARMIERILLSQTAIGVDPRQRKSYGSL